MTNQTDLEKVLGIVGERYEPLYESLDCPAYLVGKPKATIYMDEVEKGDWVPMQLIIAAIKDWIMARPYQWLGSRDFFRGSFPPEDGVNHVVQWHYEIKKVTDRLGFFEGKGKTELDAYVALCLEVFKMAEVGE